MNGFDARMRRLLADADTAPGFEARVLARIAALAAAPAKDGRVRAEHQRELLRRRLRREAWLNGVIVAGIGTAGVALVLRHGTFVAGWVERIAVVASDPPLSMGFALTLLALGLWPLLRSDMTR